MKPMKREGGAGDTGFDFDPPPKRARNCENLLLRILISSRVAGSIIGKSGANITQLRSENKATIVVPDSPGPERILSIEAFDLDEDVCFDVLSKVLPLIDEASASEGQRIQGRDSIEVRLLFHYTQVGCIIGKGGSHIKELRQTTNTHIKVYGNCCPDSTDRVVAVSGNANAIINAVKQIVCLVRENPAKEPFRPYNPLNFDAVFAINYGGFGESRGGYGSGNYGDAGRGQIAAAGRGRVEGFRGGRGNVSTGGGRRGVGFNGGGGSRGHGGMGNTFNRGRDSREDDYGGGRDRICGNGNGERISTQVTIPKEYAGAIIGRAGVRIRNIRAESGADITIDEALPGAVDRIITIVGSNGQIKLAQFLLQQSVKEHGDPMF